MQRLLLENSFLRSRIQKVEENSYPLTEAIRRIQIQESPKFSEDSPAHKILPKVYKKSSPQSEYRR